MVGEVKVLLKLVSYSCGITILETRYFLPIMLLFLGALLLTVLGLLCTALLSCVYLSYFMCIFLLCAYCCLIFFSCGIAGYKLVSGKSWDRPTRHRFFLVSLCL